jgi:hypothetical protein
MTAGKPNVKMKFRVTPGSRVRVGDVQALGETFERIKAQSGLLTAEAVWQEAQDPKSVLHKYVTWDVEKAAHQYQLEQCRRLIRSIEVVLEDAKGKTVAMKGYFNVRDADGQRSYEAMEFVLESTDLTDQVINDALAQFEALKVKLTKLQWAKSAIPPLAAAIRAFRKAAFSAKKKKKA